MEHPGKSDLKSRLVLVLSSVLFFLFLLLIAEFTVRLFATRVTFQGTDHRMIRDKAFDNAFGWQPNSSGVVFGNEAKINSRGFRDLAGPAHADSSILLIGDSVLFGVGVDAESTFAGIMQRMNLHRNVLNSGVVGYSASEYVEVANALFSRDTTIKQVLIFFSLNDFYAGSLAVGSSPWLGFFRNHSKLYLVLKHLLFDRSKTYFNHDFSFYDDNSTDVAIALTRIDSIATTAEQMGIRCSVILLPYEYQLRVKDDHLLLPQRMISEFLQSRKVDYVDAYAAFAASKEASGDLFLYGDHMHLSARGHAIVADLVKGM